MNSHEKEVARRKKILVKDLKEYSRLVRRYEMGDPEAFKEAGDHYTHMIAKFLAVDMPYIKVLPETN